MATKTHEFDIVVVGAGSAGCRPDVVQQHCGRFLPPDKAAVGAKILNQAEKQHEELCQTEVRPSAT
ncbi:hypothetical protein [Neorhizobium galegae]|uniref:hypothetical protein n=1 Tax=Neorhizobium galegae TaxID=399 RepID=UPI00126E0BEA|nr:hypothetical protein [Neorhizobium galegae]KAA9384041.1 hypothetical protein F4V88_27750 [Neorhizobium galegae]MCM2498683.1 hypothetical protein [Neorhizobium galegae]